MHAFQHFWILWQQCLTHLGWINIFYVFSLFFLQSGATNFTVFLRFEFFSEYMVQRGSLLRTGLIKVQFNREAVQFNRGEFSVQFNSIRTNSNGVHSWAKNNQKNSSTLHATLQNKIQSKFNSIERSSIQFNRTDQFNVQFDQFNHSVQSNPASNQIFFFW